MKYFFHIPVALILAFVAAVVLTFYLVTQTNLAYKIVNFALAKYIETQYDVRIQFAHLGGSLWDDIVIDNIRIDTKMPGEQYRLARIEQIRVYYDYRKLFRRQWVFDSLFITGPTVIIRSDTSGAMMLPKLSSGEPNPDKTGASPNINVGHFVLERGRFQ
ncbi:MAG: hypothetical protein WBP42_02235, partial [Candidatus Zixiibacteriota bacterium]